MAKSTAALTALNLFAMLVAVFGLTAQSLEPMSVALVIGLMTALVNGVAHLRRDRAPATARAIAADDLDARAILDLDARLEAVERAQADADDAARWRALAADGYVSGPPDESPEADPGASRGHTRNGHR